VHLAAANFLLHRQSTLRRRDADHEPFHLQRGLDLAVTRLMDNTSRQPASIIWASSADASGKRSVHAVST
jgi:hypothetical protein